MVLELQVGPRSLPYPLHCYFFYVLPELASIYKVELSFSHMQQKSGVKTTHRGQAAIQFLNFLMLLKWCAFPAAVQWGV